MEIFQFFEKIIGYARSVPNSLVVIPESKLDKDSVKNGSYAYCNRILLPFSLKRLDLYDYNFEEAESESVTVKDLVLVFSKIIDAHSVEIVKDLTIWIPCSKKYRSIIPVGSVTHVKLKDKIVILLDIAGSRMPSLTEVDA